MIILGEAAGHAGRRRSAAGRGVECTAVLAAPADLPASATAISGMAISLPKTSRSGRPCGR
jgi:hypothetical protein